MTVEYDYLIKDATIVDGSKPSYRGSIGVKGEKVAAVGDVKGDAKKTVDAEGLTALPGFIDAHSHHDGLLLWYPKCESYAMMGVTTFVGGQCGGSPAPIGDMIPLMGRLSEYHHEYVPHKYYPDKNIFPRAQVNEWMREKFGWTIDWRTYGEFMKVAEDRGISINFVPLLGHGTVRRLVMGEDYKRYSKPAELEAMDEHIHVAMKEGCVGMTTGLDYDPDVFASREEVNRHVALLKPYGGVYVPHWRRTGRRRGLAAGSVKVSKIDGLNEIIDTCRVTGVSLHFAHISTGWYIEPIGAPEMIEEANIKATLAVVDRARAEGLDVTFDVIPQLQHGGFENLRYLISLLAPWLRELGSREALGKWLKVPDFRDEVRDAILKGKVYWREGWNPNLNSRWSEQLKVIKHKDRKVTGKTVSEVAAERKKDHLETFFDIIAEDPDCRAVTGFPPGRTGRLFYSYPHAAVGCDMVSRDTEWEGKTPPYGIAGSNTYTAFPALYKKLVEEDKLLTVEEFVQRSSVNAAKAHNLNGRGYIKKGGYADVVLLDLPNLKITADALEPRRHPQGVRYVFVNGKPVVEKGKHTGAPAGKVLRRE